MGAHILHIFWSEGLLQILALYPLALIFCHPSTPLLALARMEIGIEHSEERTVFIKHLIGFNIRMIDGNVLVLLKGDAVETISQSEDATNHFR